jgi:6-phosphogluconolactonase
MPVPPHHERYDALSTLQQDFRRLIQDALQVPAAGPPALLLLSGGNTPLPVYRNIAANPFPVSDKAYIGLTDERHVPITSDQSNFGNMLPMITALELPRERVLRVHTDLSLKKAAERYQVELQSFLESGGIITAAVLGIGTDGHTCSLFSETDLQAARDQLAIMVRKKTPPDRVSITPKVLEQADRIVFLAVGKSKQKITRELIVNPDNIIAGKAVKNCARVEIWEA